MKPKETPDIFSYMDFKEFLADYYQARKKSGRGYSYRQFSQQAGFRSPNVLKEVIEGQRKLTGPSLEQFVKALALNPEETEYFRCLVALCQATSETERDRFAETLKTLAPLAKSYELEADAMEFIQHWIYPVIQELIQADDFRDDPLWIKRRLTSEVDVKDIASALSFLKRKGFIYKDADGRFQAKDQVITSSDEVRSMALRAYYRRIMEQSIRMLEELPLEKREFGALILYLPEEDLIELKGKLKSFLTDLHRWGLSREKKAGQVVQFNLQMYPQTKTPGKG